MNKIYNDYPTEPIEKGNPYFRCAFCKRPVPQINGKLENHSCWCEYRINEEAEIEAKQNQRNMKEENDWLKYLLSQFVSHLPEKRDWLDPEIEKAAKCILRIK